MKKILFIIIFLLCEKVYAINNITIDGENIIPKFDSNIKVYNYYTDKDMVKIMIDEEERELILNNDYNEFLFDEYKIRVFKKYIKSNDDEVYLRSLNIIGYDIHFDKNTYEYDIELNNQDNLNIEYELSNDNGYVIISGNGNFNKTNNLITINVNDQYFYKIHAFKTMNVSYIENDKNEVYVIKKEIAKYIVITISCIFVFVFNYLMFKKNHFYI